MEDYKKKYEEALERAKSYHKGHTLDVNPQAAMEYVFPELKESEDERIREQLLNWFKGCKWNAIDNETLKRDDIIAWLEKQGEQSHCNGEVNDEALQRQLQIWFDKGKCSERDEVIFHPENFGLQKQGEQKPFDYENANIQQKDFASKVEPKFKVGDWVVYNRDDSSREIIQVYDIRDGRYYFTDNVHFSWSIKECDEKAHLWTIQDAKDGDVLYSPCLKLLWIFKSRGTLYCGCNLNYNDGAFCGVWYFERPTDAIPATKEQRDLLLSKMKEAGYEWDAEKKELKKIKQNSTNEIDNYDHKEVLQTIINEQNPAWSEEDEPQKELAETYLTVFDKKFPILPTLRGKQLADYKNFLNKCQQIFGLKYWGIRPLQAKLFEKLSLLWAAWGAEHLQGLGQTNGDTDNEMSMWSEEDETMLKRVIDFIPQCMTAHGYNEYINWLKSLKERIKGE